ncbi:MAG TPA: hypothetical protein VGU03_11030 [Frateuria sp.]|uniref:hypothetical protein n=1 Tax=Frateuria sp. TaxID=2211372 RepID=UPI002DF70AF5|nr:hypothetical protein [Frateuria sp.]
MEKLTDDQLRNVVLLAYASELAMQGVLLALIQSQPDPVALRAAMQDRLSAIGANVALGLASLGGNDQLATLADEQIHRWLAEAAKLAP